MMTCVAGEEDRDDLVNALFALITARLEDAAALAASGQNPTMTRATIRDLANQMMSVNDEVRILLRAALAVLPTE